MSNETITTPQSESVAPSVTSWRTVDIVVASSIAAAFGVIFWAWGQLWNAAQPAFTGFPPAQGFMYGVWLLPGVLGALIIRKPGAAIYTELVASIISAFLGTAWGLQVVLYGLVEGAAPELVFAFLLYRSWKLPAALAAGAVGRCRGRTARPGALLRRLVRRVAADLRPAAGRELAGDRRSLGAWLLVRALAKTGVLAPFASGRDQAPV